MGWPDNIVFWSGGPTGPAVLGAYEMYRAVGDARSATTRVSYEDGVVVVESLDSLEGDAACCPTGRARVTLRWEGSKVVASDIVHIAPPDPNIAACAADLVAATTCDFVEAVVSGDWSGLSPAEQAVAGTTSNLPDRDWLFDSCEAIGDISSECRVVFPGGIADPEGTAATFLVQPVGGTYDFDSGYTWPPGVDPDYEVVDYGGLGA